jgi:hypothetical protein
MVDRAIHLTGAAFASLTTGLFFDGGKSSHPKNRVKTLCSPAMMLSASFRHETTDGRKCAFRFPL